MARGPRCSPPPPTVEQLLEAARKIPVGSGLSWDLWHPRALQRLPRPLLTALIRILAAAEREGKWPAQLDLVVIALLTKPGGGFRPIGLFPSIIRIWGKLRRPLVDEWERAHERNYFYAGKGCGAEVGAFKQASRAELANVAKAVHGMSMIDLVKCFDTVPHSVLVEEAAATGYNL